MNDIFSDIKAELDRAAESLAKPQIVRIFVTSDAIPGTMVVLPMLAGAAYRRFKRKGYKRPQELMVHPDDWTEIEKYAKKIAPDVYATMIHGIPVEKEEDQDERTG